VRAAQGVDKKLITGVTVFDVYEGKGIDDGKKSIAIAVTIQPREENPDRSGDRRGRREDRDRGEQEDRWHVARHDTEACEAVFRKNIMLRLFRA